MANSNNSTTNSRWPNAYKAIRRTLPGGNEYLLSIYDPFFSPEFVYTPGLDFKDFTEDEIKSGKVDVSRIGPRSNFNHYESETLNRVKDSYDMSKEVTIKDGKIYHEGKLFSCNELIFVVTKDDRLLITNKYDDQGKTIFQHTFFTNGLAVKDAGRLTVVDGKITKTCNSSGHYAPSIFHHMNNFIGNPKFADCFDKECKVEAIVTFNDKNKYEKDVASKLGITEFKPAPSTGVQTGKKLVNIDKLKTQEMSELAAFYFKERREKGYIPHPTSERNKYLECRSRELNKASRL